MKIILNGLSTLTPRTGIGHYISELYAELVRSFPSDQFYLYPGQYLRRMVSSYSRNISQVVPQYRHSWRKKYLKAASEKYFQFYSMMISPHVYHEPNFIPFPVRVPTVITVHDLSVLKFPHWHPADRVHFHHKLFLSEIQNVDHIIVVSNTMRQELIRDLGYPAEKITTVYNGIGELDWVSTSSSEVQRKWSLPSRFFLCVGTIEPRKNLGCVMKAYADLPAQVRSDCPLILAGPWGWHSEADRSWYESTGYQKGIRHLGYIPQSDLSHFFRLARALLFPSFYEGFGLPPVEMLACNGAVVSSTDPTLQEVLGSHAIYVHPHDIEGWREVMKRIAQDDDYHQSISEGGAEYARRYTWKNAAINTMMVYKSIANLR
jgi:alpha-1,3-rhamnosyl/mannosyltransferase